MLKEAESFWESISSKVKQLVQGETKNAMRCERFDVITPPDGTVIGVRQPLGTREVFIPYSAEVATATAGDTVLVVWWGSMSNAKAYYFGNGYAGSSGGGGSTTDIGSITLTTTWTQQADDWTQTATVSGATVTATSKVDLQPDTTVVLQLIADGVKALLPENNNGTLTIHAVGASAPTATMTIQVSVTEVIP